MASWLWGGQKPQDFSQFVPPSIPGSGGDDDDGNNDKNDKKLGHNMDAYRFDSAALERAAKAAKELEKSAFAQQALDLSKAQEETKQKEILTKAKEYEFHIENAKNEGRKVEAEERRKNMQEQAKLDQQKVQYQDQLARKRYEDQLVQQKHMNEDNLRKQEESVAKQEAMRKATIEHEMDSRLKYDIKRQQAEMTARAKIDRENQDLKLEQMKLQGEQDRETLLKSLVEKRETVISSIKTASSAIGMGLNAFISDPNKVFLAAAGVVGVTTGYLTSKGSLKIIFGYIQARIVRPTLVRETSRIVPSDVLKHPIQTVKKVQSQRSLEDVLHEVVLSPKLEERVRDISIGTKNTKFNKGIYRNLLLYGPPGTGKTLFAKKLAMHSGMDYAIITGGDIAMMGKDSVMAIHKLFDWATTSRKGLIVFIDEAEGFLHKRSVNFSEEMRLAINAFLYRTGTQTDKFMVVLASNMPETMDVAVVDRVHEHVHFPLPTLNERERLVRLYFGKYILTPAAEGKRRLKVEDFDYSEACSEVARMTEGLSAREITSLVIDWQMTTYASLKGILTKSKMLERTVAAVDDKKHKISWYSADELKKSIFSKAVIAAVEEDSLKRAAAAASATDEDKSPSGTSSDRKDI